TIPARPSIVNQRRHPHHSTPPRATTMTSLRQTEANRINALKSTGPVTDQGKQQSRRNALRHGLAGAGVVLPDDEEHAVARRAEDWAAFLDPAGDRDDWLVEQVALESVRLDRCQHQERARRAADAARAEVAWDDDRRIDAEALAAGLAKKPALLRRKLEMTTQGCDLLIERWHGLLGLLQSGAPWDGARRSLALDLLGVPPELRARPARPGARRGPGRGAGGTGARRGRAADHPPGGLARRLGRRRAGDGDPRP